MNSYNIKVVTSDKKNAGTNAKVYIELIGKKERSGIIYLESSSTHKNKFEQGNTDSFDIKCKNVGTLTKIRIGHNNSGLSSGWHLKEVIIESLFDGRKWICECNNWLAKDEGDGKIERELYAVEMDDYGMDKFNKKSPKNKDMLDDFNFDEKFGKYSYGKPTKDDCVYKIHVTTSKKASAGTNAQVYIELFGKNERSGVIYLESSQTHKNKFEQGHTDIFEVTSKNVGSLKKIKIGHNNAGFKSGWHLKDVLIESLADGRRWICECNNWLSRDEGDGKVERELTAVEIMDDVGVGEKLGAVKGAYKVHVTTSKLPSAGTNAKVYIELIGKNDRSGVINLESSGTHKNKFEAGQTDVFEIKCKDVGSLRAIRIGHNNSGLKPGWHLKEVLIESVYDNRSWVCECNNWLAKNEADGRIERELPAVEIKQSKNKDNCGYKIYVTTSNVHSAGTNANVYIQIFGKNSWTDRLPLKSSSLHKNPFEKGNTDYFEVNALDVGDIKRIKIGHDGKGMGSGWHLKQVAIQKENGQSYEFPCDRWLDRNEDDGLIERELFPENLDQNSRIRPGDKSYIVEVFTGDVAKGGTDANVYLTMFGEKGESPEIHLQESETHRDKFERDHMDRFVVSLRDEDVGELTSIRIRHDNTGKQPEWFLDRIEIIESDTKNKYIFECKKWLALKKYDSKVDRILKEKKILEKEKAKIEKENKKRKFVPIKKQYFIKFYSNTKKKTPNEDLGLSVRLFGDRYQSRYYKYLKSKTHETKFCPNQIDLFVIESEDDLGTLYAMELKFSSVLEDISDLGLEKIEVDVNDLKYFFYFENFLKVKEQKSQLKIILFEQNAQFL